MAYFTEWTSWPPGNPFGYIPIPKLLEILVTLPQDGFITTGFNGLPVMTILDKDLKHIGMIEPQHESVELFEPDE